MFKFIILTFYISIFYVNISYAYLDPGTGSIILQTILALFAAGIATISVWWQKVKFFFKNLFKKKKDK